MPRPTSARHGIATRGTGRLVVAVLVLVAGLLFAGTLPVAAGMGAADAPAAGWSWPLQPRPRVLTGFDAPAPYGAGSRGVDLAAAAGQPVLAPAAGTVAFAGLVAGTPVVTVDHGSVATTYEPVTAAVAAGQAITRGGRLGTVAALPRLCGLQTCLHWGAYLPRSVPRTYLDPLALLASRPVRLLPVSPLSVVPGVPTGPIRPPTDGLDVAAAPAPATPRRPWSRLAVTAVVATVVSGAGLLAPLAFGGSGTGTGTAEPPRSRRGR